MLTQFPETGLTLYKTQDYWTCRELIDIANESRLTPQDKLQRHWNNKFNYYLQKRQNKKLEWQYRDNKYSVKQLKGVTIEQFYNRNSE